MKLTSEDKQQLRAEALRVRGAFRRESGDEGYPSTADEVTEVVGRTLYDSGITGADARWFTAWDYIRDMVAPASVREAEEADEVLWTYEIPEGYETLGAVLQDALEQSATGKGRERHANGLPFEEQPMSALTRTYGLGFPFGQAGKKLEEAHNMIGRAEYGAARAELLGIINYVAGAIIEIDRQTGDR